MAKKFKFNITCLWHKHSCGYGLFLAKYGHKTHKFTSRRAARTWVKQLRHKAMVQRNAAKLITAT